MLSFVILNVIMLSVLILSVTMLRVVVIAPPAYSGHSYFVQQFFFILKSHQILILKLLFYTCKARFTEFFLKVIPYSVKIRYARRS